MTGGLRPDDASPLYEQVMQRILSDIDEGVYSAGDRIPKEAELCEKYDVSRITVRRAVEELSKKGVLEKHQGKGTFVSVLRENVRLREIQSFHEAQRRQGKRTTTKVIHVKTVEASEKDAAELGLLPGQMIIETLRVRYVNNVPVVLEKNHFSMAYSYLTEYNLTESLYNILRGFGVEPTKAGHEVSLRRADSQEAKYLGVSRDTPLVLLNEVVYDQKGRPLHNSRQLIRGDIFSFKI